jgi:hypothetical protein
MSNVYSLDALRDDLDKEFAPLKLHIDGEEVVLRNLLRLPEKDRSAVLAALKAVEDAQVDDESGVDELDVLVKHMQDLLQVVAAEGKGKKLVGAIGGDMALYMKIVQMWVEVTQPGEAANSPA